jgi:hypothetical protein
LDRDTVEAVARLFIEKYAKPNTRPRSWLETARLIGLKPDPADPSKLILTENKALAGGEVLGRWRERTIHEITRRDIHDLLDRVIARGAPGAANRTLAAVRKMFSWAVSRDIIATSPCADIRPPTRENSRDRVLSDDELRLTARDAVILAISEKFYVGQTTWATACAIAKGLSNYRARAWLRVESDLHQNPDPSKIAGFFWEILKLVDEPIGERQVYRILKNNRSD